MGSFSNIPNNDECGMKCLSTAGCRSYEYSPTEKKCNLNTVDAPSRGIYKDYAFCVAGNSLVAGLCPIYKQKKYWAIKLSRSFLNLQIARKGSI